MDPKLLADALVLLLAPVLPSLLAAGGTATGKAVEEVGKRMGGAASDKVKDVWSRLRGKVDTKEAAKEAATDLALAPDDQDLQIVFRNQLVKILTADPALAADLAPRVEAITNTNVHARDQAVVATHGGVASRTVAVGGNVYGGISVTGEGGTDPDALRRDYLTRLMEQVGVLALEGIDPAAASKEGKARLRLEAVYTALRTLSLEDRERLEEHQRARRLSALEQLNREKRLVLLGDPGSGKSTFVHFVALCHAGEILGLPINLALLRTPLPDENRKKPEPQPWDHGALPAGARRAARFRGARPAPTGRAGDGAPPPGVSGEGA